MDLKKLIKYADSPENSKIRAEIWGDFVGWDNRRRGENGFLINQLKKYTAHKILDVALGDGVDTIYLLQNGFDVSSNEIDDAFREKAIENAEKARFEIQPTNLDWRELLKSYPENSFDAVLCIGNSLACFTSNKDYPSVLSSFYSVLKSGRALLIDERNYQEILDKREAALAGTFPPSTRFLFTGTDKVKHSFVEISDNLIIHQYIERATGKKAYYLVYPLKKGELLGLLREAGFSKIEQYSDYELGENPEADFYQYVCIK